jgi:diguanylate cyclase (GGDEF)-like protein
MNRISVRLILAGAIFIMGNLAMVLVYVSGEVYKQNLIGSQRELIRNIVSVRLRDVKERLDKEMSEAVQNISQRVDTNRRSHQRSSLRELHLITSLQIGDLTTDTESIRAVFLFDKDFSHPLEISANRSAMDLSASMCPPARSGLERAAHDGTLSPSTRVCVDHNHPYYVLLSHLGSGNLAYAQVVADPVPLVSRALGDLHMAGRIVLRDGTVVYQSPNWSARRDQDSAITVDAPLSPSLGGQTAQVYVVHDIGGTIQALQKTGYAVMIAAAGVTFLTILLFMRVLQRTTLDPLTELALHVRKIREDRNQLGRRVIASGNAEVYELAEGFNEMTMKLRGLYESLEKMAFMDTLTKLPNRALFNDRLEQAILWSRRTKKPFVVAIMDLDRFKEINDTLGHQVGDSILQQVGLRLLNHLRESDTVARLGGDEFALLLQATDEPTATRLARNVLEALKEPFDTGSRKIYIGASIGIAGYPNHGNSATEIMQKADIAMYGAKRAKTGVAIYDVEFDRDSQLDLVSDLRRASGINEFTFLYQPKVGMKENQVEGVETLVRWRRGDHDVASPDVFIPLLEQTGQIRDLTSLAIREALSQHRDWKNLGYVIPVAVNLSTQDLKDPMIVSQIASLLEEYGVASGMLELEITESSIMDDPVRSLDILDRLSALGVLLTIDDFGTGYSSLSYLKQLPVRCVKIDRSFVMGMVEDKNDATIVRTSIDLAHNLGLKVVAEGVESIDAMNMLADLGCDSAQGYFISMPEPPGGIVPWMIQSPWSSALRA